MKRLPPLLAPLLALAALAAALSGCGGEPRAFGRPTLLAAFPDGARLALFDADDPRILVLSRNLRLLHAIRHPRIAPAWGMSVNETGEILLATRRIDGAFRDEAEREAATFAEVLVFSAEGELRAAHAFRAADGGLAHPATPRMMPDGTILVPDYSKDRVVAIDGRGALASFFGRPGDGPGDLRYPNDLIPLPGERFLAVETYNSRLQAVDALGRHLGFPGERGTAEGRLLFPEYACRDAAGNIYVTEMGTMRVSVFAPDLAFRRVIPVREALPGRPLVQLFGIAVLPEAGGAPMRLLVADALGRALHLFDAAGTFVATVGEAAP